jgi:hypothetical protein
MRRVLLSGLVEIAFRLSPAVRLCDGGIVRWGPNTFRPKDAVAGVIAGFEAMSEGVGDELPSGTLTLAVPTIEDAITLAQPGQQGSPVRMWIAERDADTGAIVGTPSLMADWLVDRIVLEDDRSGPNLNIDCVSRAQKLLLKSSGNSLNGTFQKQMFPGELGLDNAIGMEVQVAWGVASARGVAVGGGFGVGAGGGGGGGFDRGLLPNEN